MMRSPEALYRRLRTAWSRNRVDWLAGQGEWPLCLPINAPTEAQVMADWLTFDHWLRQWQEVGHGRVVMLEKRWSWLGEQSLPSYWCFDDAWSVAQALDEAMRWQRAMQRHQQWRSRFDPDAAYPLLPRVLARNIDRLADTEESQFHRLGEVLEWLLRHPDSGLYLRQLPIAGIDSKWIEPWRGFLADVLQALGREAASPGFHSLAGLLPLPQRVRLRVLDPALRACIGGMGDVEAPLLQIAGLPMRPRHVLVVENRDSGLALSDLPDTVAFMALGYAVDQLAGIPWLAGVRMAYWGDIDSHGLAILDRLRHHFPGATSLMMDEVTLLAHRELSVREQRPSRAALRCLNPEEAKLHAVLQAGHHGADLRLEQERLPWDWAWSRILQWSHTAAGTE